MTHLIVRRLLLAIPLIFIVTILTFLLAAVAPGNAAETILGSSATPEQLAALTQQLGLNDPVLVQYWHWLEHALTGNLGTSVISAQSVSSAIDARLPVTLSLVVGATLVSAVFGVALGLISALRGGFIGRLTDVLAMLGFATPSFWLGLILVYLFAVKLRVLPATGYVSYEDSISGWLESLVLPVLTLAAVGVTGIAKQTRDSMQEVMGRDFIVALRAEGIPEWRIVFGHALRNAAIPIVTVGGVFFITMLGGTVLVESVFAMPGLGSLAVTSAQSGDLTMLQGVALVFCVIVVLANLLVDLTYGWLNPKARVE